MEEKQRQYQKKLGQKENELDNMNEMLVLAEIKAEEKEKLFRNAEQEIAQLERTIILKEQEVGVSLHLKKMQLPKTLSRKIWSSMEHVM